MRSVRARTVWSLTLLILIVSETAAHSLAHGLVGLEPSARHLLEHSTLGIGLALVAAILARRAVLAFQVGTGPLPSWRLAAVPSAAFLAQEHLERFFHDGELGWLATPEPAVVAGVLLQLPCGLFALWLVRSLLRVADELGYALASGTARRVEQAPALQTFGGTQAPPLRLHALARGLAERAPPAFA